MRNQTSIWTHFTINICKYLTSFGYNLNFMYTNLEFFCRLATVKQKIINAILEEAEQYLGAAMTYSLFEFVKEKEKELIEDQPEVVVNTDIDTADTKLQELELESKKAPKKEILTKAQKRRQWDKVDSKGEKPRGWNWVDLVKHLSQTGSKTSPEPEIPSRSTTS